MIVNQRYAFINATRMAPPSTHVTATAPVAPTPAQKRLFKEKGMCEQVLNTCDEDSQLWISNNMNKIKSAGTIIFKMLSTKIVQYTRATVPLACTSLHTMTLKDYNNNTETLVNKMESKIKLLSCGGEEPHSVFVNVFCMFSKAPNDEFYSLV